MFTRRSPAGGLSDLGVRRGSGGGLCSPRIALAALGVVALLVLLSSNTRPAARPLGGIAPSELYGIMIDAGSTGSRIHVYRFRRMEDELVLETEIFKQLKPGLSSYKDDPNQAAQSLAPLIDVAMRAVPESHRSMTPINLKATAGLRLLGVAEAEAILVATRQYLRSLPFYYDVADAVEIMDGLDEALYGWVTINYLKSWLAESPTKTAVILDLGGGSTQIALSSTDVSLRSASVMGFNHHMFLYSHLGYGLMAARAGVLANGMSATDPRRTAQAPIMTPCMPSSTTTQYHYGSDSFNIQGEESHGARSCLAATSAFIKAPSSSFQQTSDAPSPMPGQPVFAMSYYYDRGVNVKLIQEDAHVAFLRPQQFLDAAYEVCELTPDEILDQYPTVQSEHAAFLCMDLCIIYSLLVDGFKVQPQTEMTLAKKLPFQEELIETQWSLGASLAEVSETLDQLL
eukprot:m.297309 g.297309  ORF g.297309 m.297309 type:complete len:457 (+) comp13589_c0_seq1:1001-2371(+)